jgi:hypothetical protein
MIRAKRNVPGRVVTVDAMKSTSTKTVTTVTPVASTGSNQHIVESKAKETNGKKKASKK